MPTLDIEGRRFHYEEHGAGPALLLVPGTGGHTGMLAELAAQLAGTHRVMSYDRRGFGRTGGGEPQRRSYLRRHTADAAAFLRARGAVPATVFGWSFGGIVALAAAIDHPDLVERLVLFEPPLHAKRHPTPGIAWGIGGAIVLGKLGLPRRGAAHFFRWAVDRRDGGDPLAALPPEIRASLEATPRSVLAELEAGTGEELRMEDLRRIRCPVAVLVGGQSRRLFEDAAMRLVTANPSTRRIDLPDADHVAVVLQPKAVAAAILQALGTMERGSATDRRL
jgi:pimeloyl-ACP methyl ester carboxylesterase